MINLKSNCKIIFIVLLTNSGFVHAQEDFGPPPPPQETVPINDFIVPFFIVAILLGAYFFCVSNKKIISDK